MATSNEPPIEQQAYNSAKNIEYKWDDITTEFLSSVKSLEMGELFHDEMFGLFEAMSAIEMMDPKMDAGMACNRGTRKAKTFLDALSDDDFRLDDIHPTDTIGIIDTTLACIVSWLEGHSMAQTVFTNLYLHRPYIVEDKIMKAFCFVIYKLLELIKDYVHKAQVYEEEDFQPMQYGYHLIPDISEQRMIGMLREVEEELHRKVRINKEVSEIQALHVRIKFLRTLYQSLIIMKREDQLPNIADCQRLLQASHEALAVMQSTVHLGATASDNELMKGFEPMVNQRLLPPTFPRYTKIKPRNEALIYFGEMIERFKQITRVPAMASFHQVLEFFISFSRNNPCLLSRSALQLIYQGKNEGSNLIVLRDALREAIKLFICPPALVSKSYTSNQQVKKYIDSFLLLCCRPFANLLNLCGHNRARQRDKLAHLLVEFTSLQEEAERVDAFLHNISVQSPILRPHLACFGIWSLYHTLKIMIMYLMSGFELELYSKHEYYYIYWYLYECLYGWLISALSRADSFLVENEIVNEMQKTSKATSKKKAKNKRKTRPYSKDITHLQVLQNLCGGYYKALMGFRLDGKITMPNPQFDSERVRYEHRFAPFQNLLTPPPVHYNEFREMTSLERIQQQQPVDSVFLYITGCKNFHHARQLLEKMPADSIADHAELLRVAKTNFVVLKLLAGGHKKDSQAPPEFDFSASKYFPVIKLT